MRIRKEKEIRKDRTHLLLSSAKRVESQIRRLRKLMKTTKLEAGKKRLKDRIEKKQQIFNKQFLRKTD